MKTIVKVSEDCQPGLVDRLWLRLVGADQCNANVGHVHLNKLQVPRPLTLPLHVSSIVCVAPVRGGPNQGLINEMPSNPTKAAKSPH